MIDRGIFYAKYRSRFGRLNQEQVNGLNFLLQKLDDSKVFNFANQYVGILANIMIETDWTYQPIRERGKFSYFKYLIGKFGMKTLQEAYNYRGGGFIMTTGKSNFITMNYYVQKVFPNINIIENPNEITNPEVSWITTEVGLSRGLYTGKKVTDYLTETKTDYFNFRRCINGTDRAREIAGYAVKLEECIEFTDTQYSEAEINDIINLS